MIQFSSSSYILNYAFYCASSYYVEQLYPKFYGEQCRYPNSMFVAIRASFRFKLNVCTLSRGFCDGVYFCISSSYCLSDLTNYKQYTSSKPFSNDSNMNNCASKSLTDCKNTIHASSGIESFPEFIMIDLI